MLNGKASKIYDKRWRLNHLYKIVNKQGKLQIFKENGIQTQVNDCRNRWQHVLKYRQGGITTNGVLRMLDFVAFNKNKSACILAHKKDTLEKIFNIVRLAHLHMPDKYRPEIAKGGGSKYEMFFPVMNSRIFVTLDLRGGTVNWLHISEAAFAEKMRIDATLEAVPVDTGIVVFESTPNGLGNHFYKDWVDPDHRSAKLFFPWYFHKEYVMDGGHIKSYTKEEEELIGKAKRLFNIRITKDQIAFRRHKKKTSALFIQEYPEDDKSCFLASGKSAMDLEKISDLLNNLDEPLEVNGELELFKPFNSNSRYCVGADTAQGVGSDYSVATVFNSDTLEQVAQISSNKWRPREFALKIYDLCRMFHKKSREWPLLGVELNNHGHAVLLELDEHLNYPNLFSHKEDQPGWRTDSVTRPLMVDAFIDGVENGTVKINSRNTLNECLTLIDNKGKIEAEAGEHDDCVIASAIAIQMSIEQRSNLDIYNDLSSKILF